MDNFKAIYPSLRLMGEEEADTIAKFETALKPEDVDRELIKQEFLNGMQKQRKDFLESVKASFVEEYSGDIDINTPFEKFNTKDAVVWIDPLDGTSDFVNGNLTAVTVLIGVAINDYGRIGIVHNPFSEEDQTKSRTIFGTIEQGAFKIFFNE